MRRTASEVIRNLETRIARLERQNGRVANTIKDQAESELRKTLNSFESKVEGMIKSLAKRFEAYERDPRVDQEQDTLGAEMGQIQPEYLYLVSDAPRELERALEKVVLEIETILESAENLEAGLNRMDRM